MRTNHVTGAGGWRRTSWLAMSLLLCVATAEGAVITVGNHVLLPNTPNQTITLSVSGGEEVAGLDLFVQIGDGGAFAGGANSTPVFQNVDIITGTIFGSNNSGQSVDSTQASHPLIWDTGTTTNTGTVAASGLLATITVNTTGFLTGSLPLIITGVDPQDGPFDTVLRDSGGAAIALTVTNGSVSVPEPTGVSLILLTAGFFLANKRRH